MTVWAWNAREGRFEDLPEGVGSWTLLAADSWFVDDGRVRAFDRHQARFAEAVAQVGVGDLVTAEFWKAVVETIPETGEWFPRVDVLEPAPADSRFLAFRLRPAPPRTRELRVLIPPYSDPRRIPGRKGPDIALLERLRTRAREEYDCDEVLLLSEGGFVIEAATTSLLWWDGDTLCAPDPGLGALLGVTSAVILDQARARSVPVDFRRVRPEELNGHEVWLVNALHGIRRVREFVDGRSEFPQTHEQPEEDPERLSRQQWSESRRYPISLDAVDLHCP